MDRRRYTRTNVPSDRWSVSTYGLITRVLGFTFGVKRMDMAGVSFSVAAFSFLLGRLMRTLLGVDI